MSLPDDPHLADALAQAERRRAMLAELAEIGMNLARDVGAHAAAAMSAINEDNGGDPTRAFATVSRAVRLTLAMEARNDAHILALRKGRVPAGWGAAAATVRAVSVSRSGDSAGEGPGALRENLIDREDDEAFLDLPFDEQVETIRRDLGVAGEAAPGSKAGTGCGLRQALTAGAVRDRSKRLAHSTAGSTPASPAQTHRRE